MHKLHRRGVGSTREKPSSHLHRAEALSKTARPALALRRTSLSGIPTSFPTKQNNDCGAHGHLSMHRRRLNLQREIPRQCYAGKDSVRVVVYTVCSVQGSICYVLFWITSNYRDCHVEEREEMDLVGTKNRRQKMKTAGRGIRTLAPENCGFKLKRA